MADTAVIVSAVLCMAQSSVRHWRATGPVRQVRDSETQQRLLVGFKNSLVSRVAIRQNAVLVVANPHCQGKGDPIGSLACKIAAINQIAIDIFVWTVPDSTLKARIRLTGAYDCKHL
jgi:hypothetical protein